MVREHEIVALFLGLSVLVFFVAARQWLKVFPGARWFTAAFATYVIGWVFTILEGPWGQGPTASGIYAVCNLVEHACYLIGAVLFLLYVRQLCRTPERDRA